MEVIDDPQPFQPSHHFRVVFDVFDKNVVGLMVTEFTKQETGVEKNYPRPKTQRYWIAHPTRSRTRRRIVFMREYQVCIQTCPDPKLDIIARD